ncbi:DUF2207 domain-containing protein [bacterium]|nr:DUF2207 domain-containing protein [bacterium]
MRVRLICPVFLISLLFVLTATVSLLADKSFSLPQCRIEAHILSDGRMAVTEFRRYEFNGRYKYAYRELPKTFGLTFSDISVGEAGVDFEESTGSEPGTFLISDKDKCKEVRWFFRAQDEQRTFKFSYVVQGVITRYEDVADFSFTFIDRGWEYHHYQVDLEIFPPSVFEGQPPKVWVHGPRWDVPVVTPAYTIKVSGGKLSRDDALAVRVLYPAEIFSGMPVVAEIVKASVIREEAALMERQQAVRAAEEEQYRELQARIVWGKWLTLSIVLIGCWIWWRLFLKYGKHPKFDTSSIEELRYNPPARTPPALVSYLLGSKQVSGNALVSTLFDLAQRGFLILEDLVPDRTIKQRKQKPSAQWRILRNIVAEKKSELTDYEYRLLTFLFDEIANGADVLPLKLLKKRQSKVQSFFPKWSKLVKNAGDSMDWYDTHSYRGMYWSMGLGGLIMLMTIPAAMLFHVYGLILMGGGFLILMLSFVIAHRTPDGEHQYRQWRSYKKFLLKAQKDATIRSQGLSYIVEHLIYGLAVGLMPHHMEKIAAWIDPDRAAALLPWFKLPEGLSIDIAFVPVMAAILASTTTTVTSAAGVSSGGASAGAGGAG